ncbi:MAG: MlaD family protein [Sandaracinaceae bacterium]
MRDRVRAARVGVLVVAALVGGFLVWRAVDERSTTDTGYQVHALFEDASGLIPKSRVTVAGIPVGYIEEIRLDGALARVEIVVDDDVALYEDAAVERRSASLLGEYVLAINPGNPALEPLEDGDRIAVVAGAPEFSDILRDVGAIAGSVRSVATQVERVFGTEEGGQRMESALRNLSEALEAVNETIQENRDAVTNTVQNVEGITARAAPRLDGILANIEAITADLRDVIEHNRDGLDEGVGEVGPTIASINRAAQQLERVLEDVGEVTERTAAGEGTVGRLVTDERLVNEVEEAAEGINRLVGGFARLRTVIALRSEYLFLANAFKNYLDIRLAPAEDRYFLIQLVDDPRGRTRFTTVQTRTSPPSVGDPPFQEQVIATTTDGLLISFQLAKRLYFTTLRFGILESTGGIGLDLHFFDDRLEINADVFRFNEQVFPNLRVRINFEIVRTLFILGGFDNLLNSDFTTSNLNGGDFFLGAMLRFTDRDILSLLPFLGIAIPSGQ